MKYLFVEFEDGIDDCWGFDYKNPLYVTDDIYKVPEDVELYEVYEIAEDGTCKLIKGAYDEPLSRGMVYGYYTEKNNNPDDLEFFIIDKFENNNRKDKVPSKILKRMKGMKNFTNRLETEGFIMAESNGRNLCLC